MKVWILMLDLGYHEIYITGIYLNPIDAWKEQYRLNKEQHCKYYEVDEWDAK